jgi:hypothetical protein
MKIREKVIELEIDLWVSGEQHSASYLSKSQELVIRGVDENRLTLLLDLLESSSTNFDPKEIEDMGLKTPESTAQEDIDHSVGLPDPPKTEEPPSTEEVSSEMLEKLQKAANIRGICHLLYVEYQIKDLDEIVRICEENKDKSDVLKRAKNLRERISRMLEGTAE